MTVQEQEKFFRKAGAPHVYPWTKQLAARGDMLPCYRDGKLVNPDAEEAVKPPKAAKAKEEAPAK